MYQGGSLRQVQRKDGLTWLFRYRIDKDGRRVENTTRVGLVKDFPSESAAQAAPSIAKIKTLMSLVFQFGKMEKLCDNNPRKEFRVVAKSD